MTATARDAAGNSATKTFQVTVRTFERQIDDLLSSVMTNPAIAANIKNPLGSQLAQAIAISSSGNRTAASNVLGATQNFVQAKMNARQISAADGQRLIDALARIRKNLGG